MPRLIDADELLTAFPVDDEPTLTKSCVRMTIQRMPTVAAAPVRRGKWILQGDRRKTLYGWYFCSECGACIGGKANFCSECGADMREDDGMMLYDKTLQWIYDHTDDFKRAIVALDFAKQARCTRDDGVFRKADDVVHDYALSFLLMAMGEHTTKTLWSARDYSVLYGVIMDNSDDNEISDDQ